MGSRIGRAVVVALSLIAGCAEVRALQKLQGDMAAQFGTVQLSAGLRDSSLSVSVINSPVEHESDSVRAALAWRAAEFVRDHYAHYDEVITVSVEFERVRSAGPVTLSFAGGPYLFTRYQLGQPRTTPAVAPGSGRPSN